MALPWLNRSTGTAGRRYCRSGLRNFNSRVQGFKGSKRNYTASLSSASPGAPNTGPTIFREREGKVTPWAVRGFGGQGGRHAIGMEPRSAVKSRG